jgi:hypothetical protein
VQKNRRSLFTPSKNTLNHLRRPLFLSRIRRSFSSCAFLFIANCS